MIHPTDADAAALSSHGRSRSLVAWEEGDSGIPSLPPPPTTMIFVLRMTREICGSFSFSNLMKKEERERVWPKFCFDFGLSAANAPERVLTESKRERDVFARLIHDATFRQLRAFPPHPPPPPATRAQMHGKNCGVRRRFKVTEEEEEEAVEGFEKY